MRGGWRHSAKNSGPAGGRRLPIAKTHARCGGFAERETPDLATMAASGRDAVSGMIERGHFGERERESRG
jgi:hypothetical protein